MHAPLPYKQVFLLYSMNVSAYLHPHCLSGYDKLYKEIFPSSKDMGQHVYIFRFWLDSSKRRII